MTTATVNYLPGRNWNAHAVAGDIMNRAPIGAPIIAVWIGEDGKIRYSKSGTDVTSLCVFATLIQEMAQSCWRDSLK